MGKVVVSQFITMDGVVEDPGGSEGFARGGWAFTFHRGEEGDRFKVEEVLASGVLLLGRVTYEGFAAQCIDTETRMESWTSTPPSLMALSRRRSSGCCTERDGVQRI